MSDRLPVRELVLIDGRSGSGKTDYATMLSHTHGFHLLSLDEVYPGWDGLDAGQALVVRSVLPRWLNGEEVEVPLWDWSAKRYSAPRILKPGLGLIIEGCGSISRQSIPFASDSIWLDAPEPTRRSRALSRDGEGYRPHWERWAKQEQRFIDLHDSPRLASRILYT